MIKLPPSDLVSRLRQAIANDDDRDGYLCEEAADALEGYEALKAENERLQMSLKRYEPINTYNGRDIESYRLEAKRLRAALERLANDRSDGPSSRIASEALTSESEAS